MGFVRGDRVRYSYQGSVGCGTDWITRTKDGEFCGWVRHTCRWKGEQMGCVHFDGNRRVSFVPISRLRLIVNKESKDGKA
jgi:hypothetical protein